MNLDNHCGMAGCICTHSYGCERGWIWRKYSDEKIVKLPDGQTKVVKEDYEGVHPCQNCDPDRYELFLHAKNPQDLGDKLRKRGLQRHKAYEDDERAKTRTL